MSENNFVSSQCCQLPLAFHKRDAQKLRASEGAEMGEQKEANDHKGCL